MLRRVSPYLAYAYLTLVKLTTRLKINGEENRAALRGRNQRFIYAFWHNRQMFFTCSHRKDNLSVLVSLSRDGELIAKVMSLSKIRASRGSSSRNASGAIKEMMGLANEGFDLGITPDGPKGPPETAKLGAVFLAQKLGIPVLPTSNALSRKLIIKKSWDGYQVPLPFGRAVVAYANPIFVGPNDDLKLKVEELTRGINSASVAAEEEIQKESGAISIALVLFLENLLFPIIGLLVFLKFLFSRRRRVLLGLKNELSERLGFMSPQDTPTSDVHRPVWIHAASAGEVASIVPFVRLFKGSRPESRILLTSTNPQGVQRAKSLGISDSAVLAPLDFFPAVNRFIRERKPTALILVETELWPHLIEISFRKNIPIYLIGATLSQKSFKRYSGVSFLIRPFLRRFSLIAAQTQADRERFELLGADPKNIIVVGSLKYDVAVSPHNDQAVKAVARLGWGHAKIFLAASTHPGEEETVIAAYAEARHLFPDLKLVIAPRHVERARELLVAFERHKISAALFSTLKETTSMGSREVLILDTLGVLSGFYALSVLSFVGGTLIDLGGHSLIDPAMAKSPVAFGPFTDSNPEFARLLVESEAGFQIHHSAELAATLKRLLEDPLYATSAGERAETLVKSLKGASIRTLDALNQRTAPFFI